MEHRKIKMVICDIDDTLIHKEVHLSHKIIALIESLQKQQIHFTFATGRMPYRVEVFAEEAKLKIPYIANNGSILFYDGTMVFAKHLKASILKETLQPFMKEYPEFTVIFSYEDRERPLLETSWIQERAQKYKGYNEPLGNTNESWNQEVHKVYVVDGERTGLIGRVAEALSVLKDDISYYQYGEYSIEVVAKECSKATGVKRLLEQMHLNKDEVMAIGDHSNDMEVIQMVGIGVAVANANPKLKEVADYITIGEREDGVIEAVNRFVLNEEE